MARVSGHSPEAHLGLQRARLLGRVQRADGDAVVFARAASKLRVENDRRAGDRDRKAKAGGLTVSRFEVEDRHGDLHVADKARFHHRHRGHADRACGGACVLFGVRAFSGVRATARYQVGELRGAAARKRRGVADQPRWQERFDVLGQGGREDGLPEARLRFFALVEDEGAADLEGM